MHGCWGCVWLLGACMVAGGYVWQGGMHGGKGGACMARRCAWQIGVGGMHGERAVCMAKGGMCGEGGACVGYDEIRRYDQ